MELGQQSSDEMQKLREEHRKLKAFTERELLRFSHFTVQVAQFLASGSPEDRAAAAQTLAEAQSLGYGGAR